VILNPGFLAMCGVALLIVASGVGTTLQKEKATRWHTVTSIVATSGLALLIAAFVWWMIAPPPPPPTEEEKQAQYRREQQWARERQQREQRRQYERELCRLAAACEKYSAIRLECATAGNFKNCLRIKMGADATYIGPCSGFDEGAPAVPPSPETPNKVQCWFD
jgi:hypothetical protein